MGNGQKAQMKRERNAKATKGPSSQLKVNAAAKNIICKTCFQTFLCTSREKALTEHAENKHGKKMNECFPDFVAPS
ncbi:At2g23090 like protein [Halteromyces radiatus]|uniref:At2g23090 like protein n=1 Tax=Halteromyces radiatus TaxID=101107 RepID=UPI00222085B7|nr:At2g23090 like protein [Halteromyces radiatus]KAI8096697.1 At2g23090 like protein [Halteromyces radiatus]